eukprot:1690740-Amphidinium_carterae.2
MNVLATDEPLGASGERLDDLEALEASLETALRAASAASAAVQRSAHAAAASRADALLQAVLNALTEETGFEIYSQRTKFITASFLLLLEQRIPRARELAKRAGASTLDDWETSVREELMERFSNTTSQYIAPGSDWASTLGISLDGASASFQLSRGGLVSYTLQTNGEGSLHGEGTWTIEECQVDNGYCCLVQMDMRQGMQGRVSQGGGSPKHVQLPARRLTVAVKDCRRETLAEALPTDDEEGEDDEDEE